MIGVSTCESVAGQTVIFWSRLVASDISVSARHACRKCSASGVAQVKVEAVDNCLRPPTRLLHGTRGPARQLDDLCTIAPKPCNVCAIRLLLRSCADKGFATARTHSGSQVDRRQSSHTLNLPVAKAPPADQHNKTYKSPQSL